MRIPALEFLSSTGRVKRQRKGVVNLPPPLAVQAQSGVAPAHLLPIVRRVCGIGQRDVDVGDDEPPFIVVQGAADFATLEKQNATRASELLSNSLIASPFLYLLPQNVNQTCL